MVCNRMLIFEFKDWYKLQVIPFRDLNYFLLNLGQKKMQISIGVLF